MDRWIYFVQKIAFSSSVTRQDNHSDLIIAGLALAYFEEEMKGYFHFLYRWGLIALLLTVHY